LSASRVCAAVLAAFAGFAAAQDSYVNFEGKQTRPICLSPDGTRLFAVNTPDARLSVFDVTHPLNPFLIAEIPVGVEPVSVNARNNDEVWVVNEVSTV
jgi:DNA-binding beta-propeller fold protein YncE